MNQTFSKKTLVGRWFEERSAPLTSGGVLADYGENSKTTENATSFGAKRLKKPSKVLQKRYGMICQFSVNEGYNSINNGAPIEEIPYEPVVPKHSSQDDERFLQTTSQQTFGIAHRSSKRINKSKPAGMVTTAQYPTKTAKRIDHTINTRFAEKRPGFQVFADDH
eukprot:TRINITY_DN776144_c0_g1_i1.p1 TRINITY_DN776144_c0_g1~~TRINITY_DN776144_c0_g1_i1.p1  ORF type:complete len:165 (+),score=36.37 TRINITY_DN776144_c0_g1_i1:44-538(+)